MALNVKTQLKDFIEQVRVAASIRNQVGEVATAREKYQNSRVMTFMPIEEHASTVLTPYSFEFLQKEIVLSCQYAMIEKGNGSYIVRHCTKTDGGRIVQLMASSDSICCTCKEFEFSGILCRHAIRVLVSKNYFRLPDKYLPRRWRSESSLYLKYDQNSGRKEEDISQKFHFLISIMQEESLRSSSRAEYATKEIERVLSVIKGMPTNEETVLEFDQHPIAETENAQNGIEPVSISYPNPSTTKGRPKLTRQTGGVEAAKKVRHCHVPNCGGTNNDTRNCPNKKKIIEVSSTQSPFK